MSNLLELCKNLGLSMESSEGRAKCTDEWDHIEFNVEIKRGNNVLFSGPYRLGVGHVKIPKGDCIWMYKLVSDETSLFYQMQRKGSVKVKPEYKHIHLSILTKLATHQKLKPKIEDVMYSLLSEGSVFFDGQTLDEFCSDFGFSTDSIKANNLWKACLDTGMNLRKFLNPSEIEDLRKATQDH